MTHSTHARQVTIERTAPGRLIAVNSRGGRLPMGTGGDDDFSPTELLLAAIGGCTAIDVDVVTARRAEPDAFTVVVDAEKIKDDDGNRLTGLTVTFHVRFPDGEAGDAARAVLPDAVQKSHDRWCTVGRTVTVGTPIAAVIE
jgi:putative redox protein